MQTKKAGRRSHTEASPSGYPISDIIVTDIPLPPRRQRSSPAVQLLQTWPALLCRKQRFILTDCRDLVVLSRLLSLPFTKSAKRHSVVRPIKKHLIKCVVAKGYNAGSPLVTWACLPSFGTPARYANGGCCRHRGIAPLTGSAGTSACVPGWGGPSTSWWSL
jgi:hypothetical protein